MASKPTLNFDMRETKKITALYLTLHNIVVYYSLQTTVTNYNYHVLDL